MLPWPQSKDISQPPDLSSSHKIPMLLIVTACPACERALAQAPDPVPALPSAPTQTALFGPWRAPLPARFPRPVSPSDAAIQLSAADRPYGNGQRPCRSAALTAARRGLSGRQGLSASEGTPLTPKGRAPSAMPPWNAKKRTHRLDASAPVPLGRLPARSSRAASWHSCQSSPEPSGVSSQ